MGLHHEHTKRVQSSADENSSMTAIHLTRHGSNLMGRRDTSLWQQYIGCIIGGNNQTLSLELFWSKDRLLTEYTEYCELGRTKR